MRNQSEYIRIQEERIKKYFEEKDFIEKTRLAKQIHIEHMKWVVENKRNHNDPVSSQDGVFNAAIELPRKHQSSTSKTSSITGSFEKTTSENLASKLHIQGDETGELLGKLKVDPDVFNKMSIEILKLCAESLGLKVTITDDGSKYNFECTKKDNSPITDYDRIELWGNLVDTSETTIHSIHGAIQSLKNQVSEQDTINMSSLNPELPINTQHSSDSTANKFKQDMKAIVEDHEKRLKNTISEKEKNETLEESGTRIYGEHAEKGREFLVVITEGEKNNYVGDICYLSLGDGKLIKGTLHELQNTLKNMTQKETTNIKAKQMLERVERGIKSFESQKSSTNQTSAINDNSAEENNQSPGLSF